MPVTFYVGGNPSCHAVGDVWFNHFIGNGFNLVEGVLYSHAVVGGLHHFAVVEVVAEYHQAVGTGESFQPGYGSRFSDAVGIHFKNTVTVVEDVVIAYRVTRNVSRHNVALHRLKQLKAVHGED